MTDKAPVNPHNPEFITKKPWYLTGDQQQPEGDLQHQQTSRSDEKRELTLQAAEELLAQKRQKEKKQQSTSTFSKGQWVEGLKKNKPPYRICQIIAVHNASLYDIEHEDGSIERRVKVVAGSGRPRIRATASGNRATEEQSAFSNTYASKRDQYHGYDRDRHNTILQEKYETKLALRRKLREEEKQKAAAAQENGDTVGVVGTATTEKTPADADSDDFDDSDVESQGSQEDDDEFVQRDQDAKVMTTRLARQGGVGGAQMKVTARNLRIREDTAKYLRNLDLQSAYYDPKSRSMRDNPNPMQEETDFAGDNFARISGDAVGLAQQQLFAWEAQSKGVVEVHPQANPSQAELLKKKYQTQAKDLSEKRKNAVLDKYGGEEYLDSKRSEDQNIRFGASTKAEEYRLDGRTVNGSTSAKRKPLTSKYEEDIFINGHSTVWGSYFHKGAFTWGYADDHSLLKMSFCTGENGRIANDEANERMHGTGKAGSAALAQAKTLVKTRDAPAAGKGSAPVSRSKLYGEADQKAELDQSKVKAAFAKLDNNEEGKNKRKYNSVGEEEMTEEMMEAYRLRKEHKNDPMAGVGSSKLLDYGK